MCAAKIGRFDSNQLTIALEQISKSDVTLSDIEKAIGLFEKVSDILIQLKFPLSRLCSIENVSEHPSECILQNQLKRLRVSSINLLNCQKIIPNRMNQLRCNRKRESSETISESPEAKIAKHCDEKSTLRHFTRLESITNGMGLLDICYVCKKYCTTDVRKHEFYPWMCIQCGVMNYTKRNETADLIGKVALVTGGRIKIGLEIALKLLRCGATVIVTTRFPNDARRRYEHQYDFLQWSNRLHIFALDLRFIPQVEKFCEYFTLRFRQLDILIQNAAQTIRRPTVYYKALIDGERAQGSTITNFNQETFKQFDDESVVEMYSNGCSPTETSITKSNQFDDESVVEMYSNDCSPTETSQLLIHPEDIKYLGSAQLSQLHFPMDRKDEDGEQLDLRPKNSWTLTLDEVESREMVEVTLANYMSPFIMLKKLTPIMTECRNSKSDFAFIILVSAMEGKFSDCKKTGKHPHTNAAKAAVNMLVKTSARHYKKMGVLMNAVDTGWITDEHPAGYKSKLMHGLKPPLDSIDGAARVLDPIFRTVNNAGEAPLYGKFLKDYLVVGW